MRRTMSSREQSRTVPVRSVAACTVIALLSSACARTAYVRPPPPTVPAPPTTPEAVNAGTLAGAQVRQELSTASNRPGDRFTAELLDPLVDGSGRVLVERGSMLQGIVRRTDTSRIAGDAAGLQLQIVGIDEPGQGTVPLPLEVASTPVEIESDVGREILAGLAGAAAGAGAGIAIDKDRSGVVLGSSLVGASVGVLLMYFFGNRQAVLPGGSVVTLRVTQPVQLERPLASATKCYPVAPRKALSRDSTVTTSGTTEAVKAVP